MQLREDRLLQQSPLKIISSWLLMVVQGLTFPGYSEKNALVSNLSTNPCYLQHRAPLITDYVFEYTFIRLALHFGAKTCVNDDEDVCELDTLP